MHYRRTSVDARVGLLTNEDVASTGIDNFENEISFWDRNWKYWNSCKFGNSTNDHMCRNHYELIISSCSSQALGGHFDSSLCNRNEINKSIIKRLISDFLQVISDIDIIQDEYLASQNDDLLLALSNFEENGRVDNFWRAVGLLKTIAISRSISNHTSWLEPSWAFLMAMQVLSSREPGTANFNELNLVTRSLRVINWQKFRNLWNQKKRLQWRTEKNR